MASRTVAFEWSDAKQYITSIFHFANAGFNMIFGGDKRLSIEQNGSDFQKNCEEERSHLGYYASNSATYRTRV